MTAEDQLDRKLALLVLAGEFGNFKRRIDGRPAGGRRAGHRAGRRARN